MPRDRFIQFVPLFNFEAHLGGRLVLDPDTWLDPLPEATRAFVVSQVSRPDVVISREVVETLRFGLFHRFEPSNPSEVEPPDQSLELDARLVFKILKPGSAVTTGYSAHYAELGGGSAGSRLASEFPWPGPRYELGSADAARLPALWRELRKLVSPAWLFRARFFHTARVRLWKASHEQDEEQRLLDLFVAMESMLLRGGERWAEKGRSVGAARLAVLLDPESPAERGSRYAAARFADDQRNNLAHGLDRPSVGFDGQPGSFGALVREVEGWTTVAVHRMLRTLFASGSQEESLALLDAVATDPVKNARTVRLLLGG
jgi:hypothetical protein